MRLLARAPASSRSPRPPRLVWLVLVALLPLVAACGGGGAPPAPPVLSASAPAGGGVAGGTLVTLTGTALGTGDPAALVVRFAAVPATSVTVVDEGTVTCAAPAGALGPCDLTLQNAHGSSTLAAAFTYHPAPTLSGVTPPRGPAAGGLTLTLTGTGFQANAAGAPSVEVGGVPATGVTVVDDTTVTVLAPAQPALGDYAVRLVNANGEALRDPGFTCVPPPTLSAVAASSGPAGGRTRVTLTGTDLDVGALGITFDGAPATGVQVLGPTSASCLTPPGAVGTADVAVSTYGGVAGLAAAYTYTTWSPSDTLYGNQWHLVNTGQYTLTTPGEDAHVAPAWTLGYTGSGVLIGVVDDGLELLHEDLAANVAPGSWDYGGNDADPTTNAHGTSVAGVHSAVGGNSLGGTGAAPRSRVVGLAVLVSGATDGDFADALARNAATTHAYNNSWGSPAGSGSTLYGYAEAPYSFHAAVEQGLLHGRGGLGSIYLKAAGNSGSPLATFDGTNGIRGVNVIGAVGSEGTASYYSQGGPCLLVCAPSNDASPRPGITTTDRTGASGYDASNYTSTFGGTSSATPLVTGVVALVLEVNPELRWWEVPVLLARTARRNHTAHAGWLTNGAGRWVNPQYGFGVVDAGAAVDAARLWVPLTGLASWTGTGPVNALVPKGNATGVTRTLTVPAGSGLAKVHRATVTLYSDHTAASDLTIVLTSPSGTQSTLASSIRGTTTYANSVSGLPLVSWRCLDEDPTGTWTLQVSDGQNIHDSTWSSWTLTLEGEAAAAPVTLQLPKAAAAGTRPPAPAALRADAAMWWSGSRWCQAVRDDALLAEWTAEDARGSWLADQPEVTGRAHTARGFAIHQLAPSTVRAALLARAPASAPPRTGPVFRDGADGSGRLRVLSGRVLVQWRPGLGDAERRRLEALHGLEAVRTQSAGPGWVLYRAAGGAEAALDAARALLDAPDVLHAEPDWWVERTHG